MNAPLAALVLSAGLVVSTTALADPCEAPLPKRGTVFAGTVAYIGDGDSLCLRGQGGLIEVRLADLYAPELSEPVAGPAAKRALERIALGKRAVCVAGKRSWDRIVAVCTINNTSIGDAMRAAGVVEGGRR